MVRDPTMTAPVGSVLVSAGGRREALRSGVDVACGLGALDVVRDDLGVLLDDLDAPVCAQPLWLTTWARAYRSYTPWVFTLRREGELAAAGLLAERRRAGHREIVGLGHGASDYARLPARSEEDAEALAAAIADWLGGRRGPWRFRFEQLPDGDPVAAGLARRLREAVLEDGDPSPRLLLHDDRTLEQVMSSKTRQSLRTARNRLGRLEEGFSVRADRGSGATACLGDVERVHRLRDEALGRASDLDDPERLEFWRSLITAYAGRGAVEVGRLLIGSEMAAYSVAFLDRGSYRLWDTRIDPGRAFVSPGRVLLADLIERLRAEGAWSEFDYMRGEEDYKRRMSDDVVPAQNVRAWSSGGLRRLEDTFRGARRRLRRSA